MSYILKALKQAQESRSIDGTPVTAATQRMRSGERRRQIPWRWIAAGALVLNALVLGLVLLWSRFGSQAPTPAPLELPVPTIATPAPRAASPLPAAAITPAPTTVPPPPTVSPTPAPGSAAVQQPPTAAPPPVIAAQPPAAPAPPVRPPVVSAPRPKPVEPARQPTPPGRAPERASIEPAERPSGGRAAPVAPQSTQPPAAGAVAPAPAVAAAPPVPSTPDVGPELRDAMEKFKLEVLVWAVDPRDRMVFLSGRKFVEGQTLDGKVIVEAINDDSITLGYQGQRVRVKRP